MAKPTAAPAPFTTTVAPADAFLNIALVDDNGVEYNLPKGLPLRAGTPIYDFLIGLMETQPDVKLNFTGQVHSATKKALDSMPVVGGKG